MNAINWNSSAAWVLFAFPEDDWKRPASAENIIATCDYVNHAIISYDEISAALQKLNAAGFLEKENEKFRLTRKFEKEISLLKKIPSLPMKKMEALEKWLKKFPAEKSNTEIISITEYQSALAKYLARS